MRQITINNNMKTQHHILYITRHKNGKYYGGRHSTYDLDDGYLGSGIWIKEIKDRSDLTREIIYFATDVNDLIEAENKWLAENYGKTDCMNFSNTSTGAPTGNANPMKRADIAEKISGDNHWSHKDPEKYKGKFSGSAHWMNKSPEKKKEFIENNPNLDGRNSKLATARGRNIFQTNNPSVWRSEQGIHHWQNGSAPNANGELNKRLVAEGRHNFLGPDLNNRRIVEGTHNFLGSDSNAKRLAEGSHPSQIKKTCEHCAKQTSLGMYIRWHGDNCKLNPEKS
jgi:hypothetical protein